MCLKDIVFRYICIRNDWRSINDEKTNAGDSDWVISRGLPEDSDKWSALVWALEEEVTNKQTVLTQKRPNLGAISGPEFCQMVWVGGGGKKG